MASLGKGNNDFVDKLTYPYLEKLQRRIPRSVSPNSITLVGFLLMVAGALVLMFVKHRSALLVFVVLSVLATACDGLDGIHARKTGQTSRVGDFLDHSFDQVASVLVLFGLLLRFDLLTPLYVFIGLWMGAISTLAFVYKSVSGELHIGAVGPTTNLVILCVALICIFAFDDPVLWSFRPANPDTMRTLVVLGIRDVTIAKLLLLVPVTYIPAQVYTFYAVTKKLAAQGKAPSP